MHTQAGMSLRIWQGRGRFGNQRRRLTAGQAPSATGDTSFAQPGSLAANHAHEWPDDGDTYDVLPVQVDAHELNATGHALC